MGGRRLRYEDQRIRIERRQRKRMKGVHEVKRDESGARVQKASAQTDWGGQPL